MNTMKAIGVGIFLLVLTIGAYLGLTYITINNQAAELENDIVLRVQECTQTWTQGVNILIEMADVDSDTKQYLKDLIKSGSSPEIKEKYGDMLNGNPNGFLLLMSQLGGTNFTITAENMQREIVTQRTKMLNCGMLISRFQMEYRNLLGMDASGEYVKFPTGIVASWTKFPSDIMDETLIDNDFDGKLTVLDYRPPVSIDLRSRFGTGEDGGPLNLYKE